MYLSFRALKISSSVSLATILPSLTMPLNGFHWQPRDAARRHMALLKSFEPVRISSIDPQLLGVGSKRSFVVGLAKLTCSRTPLFMTMLRICSPFDTILGLPRRQRSRTLSRWISEQRHTISRSPHSPQWRRTLPAMAMLGHSGCS